MWLASLQDWNNFWGYVVIPNIASLMSNPKSAFWTQFCQKPKIWDNLFYSVAGLTLIVAHCVTGDVWTLQILNCIETSCFMQFYFEFKRKASIVNQNKGKILNFKRVVWIWVWELVFICLCCICLQVSKILYSGSLRDLLSVSFVAFLLATNKLTVIVTMRQYVVVVENMTNLSQQGFYRPSSAIWMPV